MLCGERRARQNRARRAFRNSGDAGRFRGYFPDRVWNELKSRVLDLHDRRLMLMDQHGIEMMLLSLDAPPFKAFPMSQRRTTLPAGPMIISPSRSPGAGALSRARRVGHAGPELAAHELERCVKDLGFAGALVNGFSQVGNGDTAAHYDFAEYRPVLGHSGTARRAVLPASPQSAATRCRDRRRPPLAARTDLGVRPGNGGACVAPMGSGLFDAHPRLQVILVTWAKSSLRALVRRTMSNAWTTERNTYPAEKPIREYFRQNFYVTTFRQLPARRPAQCHAGSRRRSHHVRDRLAVREHRSCRSCVRCLSDQRD